ncbi:MAG: ATP-binding protein [Gammaproteobacteria bacterium]
MSGRGVGLDIVRTSIQELGGEVGIQSGAGRGTAFMVSLPISCARVSRSIS